MVSEFYACTIIMKGVLIFSEGYREKKRTKIYIFPEAVYEVPYKNVESK